MVEPVPEIVAAPVEEIEEQDTRKATVPRPLPQSVKIRPWDFGKEGVPKTPGERHLVH